MDNANEDFWLQISSGGGYTTVEEWNLNDEFVNNSREFDAVTIQGPFSANTRLRFFVAMPLPTMIGYILMMLK